MSERDFTKGRMSRFFRLGSLSGIVGTSYLGHKVKSMVVSDEKAAESLHKTNQKNAERITKTFGQLKGAVMKVGQMMSLQAGIFPEEFTSTLSSLQQDSPPIEFSIIEDVITKELGAPLEDLFQSIDQEAFASASIGQVHRAVLPEGEQVVIKVQYPDVDKMVESDLKNLRMFFRSLGKMYLNMDVMELWVEVRERLSEELNYEHEFENMILFGKLFQDDDRIIVPEPVAEYSTRRVLTMQYVHGLNWSDVIEDSFPEETRNAITELLFETMLKQLFEFRTLHADPNLSNFAFRENGDLVLYDFGCVKKFPHDFVEIYRTMVKNALDENYELVIENLYDLGFSWSPRELIDEEYINQVAKILLRPYLGEVHYDFGTATLHDELFAFASEHFKDRVKFVIPPDIIFLDRVVGGMYGNMMKLKARGNWKDKLVAAVS